jgi:hypothetical protein
MLVSTHESKIVIVQDMKVFRGSRGTGGADKSLARPERKKNPGRKQVYFNPESSKCGVSFQD